MTWRSKIYFQASLIPPDLDLQATAFRFHLPGASATPSINFVFNCVNRGRKHLNCRGAVWQFYWLFFEFKQKFWRCLYRYKKRVPFENSSIRAEDEAQTRDPQLGRLMLYQLSYFRKICGRRWIRTTEGISQQIYSLPHLATLVFALFKCDAKIGQSF